MRTRVGGKRLAVCSSGVGVERVVGRGEMPSSAERQSQRPRPAAWLGLIGREGRVGLALAVLLQLVGVSLCPAPATHLIITTTLLLSLSLLRLR
jgi:hypothetical protein